MSFVDALDAVVAERLAPIVAAGRVDPAGPGAPDRGDAADTRLLRVALSNEIHVSELAASWVGSTRELDAKLAFARQAGDEAGHFQLVAARMAAHGFDADGFAPDDNPLFQYLRTLTATADRIAAGLYALESIAYGVNENFMAWCAARGDDDTVRIYRDYIQPDERAHQAMGRALLAKHGTDARAREVIATVFDLAAAARAKGAAKLGVACFPGC